MIFFGKSFSVIIVFHTGYWNKNVVEKDPLSQLLNHKVTRNRLEVSNTAFSVAYFQYFFLVQFLVLSPYAGTNKIVLLLVNLELFLRLFLHFPYC